MRRTIEIGEYSEGMAWELVREVRFEKRDLASLPCPHARDDGTHIVVPLIIRAFNEAGYDCTQLCAQCVQEALAR